MENSLIIEAYKYDKESSKTFKERRLNQWNENYYLSRDKVLTNRLTQRQTVNIPIIRESSQTWISKVDEQPDLSFETRGQGADDEDKELIVNEMWQYTKDNEKLDQKDNLDKKIVSLQGRSFKFLYWKDNTVKIDIIDPYDIDIDPRVNPFDIDTASFVNHKHIYIPLRNILANKSYDTAGKYQLKSYLDTKRGILASANTNEEDQMRKQRLETLGVSNFDEYRASDVMVELTRSYRMMWSDAEKRFVRHLIVIAMDAVVLYCKPLVEAIGIERLPMSTWASDPDINDFWSDGIADNVRTVNKVVNMYFSQDLENRAYRNFGMYFFNTKGGQFKPNAFEARPFGMYGVDGNPDEMIKQMNIQPLADTQAAIQYLKDMIQSSIAQTPTERGVQEKTGTTLGEVQLSLQQSQGRNQVVAKQYRQAWKDTGMIWYDLLNSNARGMFKLYKKGNDGKTYSKDVYPADWQNPKGYDVQIEIKADKEANNDLEFKKLQYVKSSYINNPVAQQIAKKKELEIIGWTPEEIDQVMQAEAQTPAIDPNTGLPVDPTVQTAQPALTTA
jgi:hypothetical protein